MLLKYKVHPTENELHLGSISRGVSLCLLTAASPVLANPQGGQIIAGQASIQYGNTTVITQTSTRAIVNWTDFSIDQNETTRINQPSNTSVILNRVTGHNISQIMGKLQANGQVFLVNPNGIVFGKNARVDVAGLVASTADIHDNDFMSGNYHFQQAPAGSKIINEGTITVHDAGLAALVAPNVENRGIIIANLGKVVLGSGSAFTVDLYGDNLITFDATSVVDHGSVDNIGLIEASGGTVMLTVAAAESIVENVINTSGSISAQSVSNTNGKIILQGYDNSTISITGLLDVSGTLAGQTGGVIQLSADYIQLLNGSFLDASGDVGGGHVHVGSDVFHNPSDNHNVNTLGLSTALRTAQFVYAASDSRIAADSLSSGNGGNVVVWGDKATWFYGKISAAAKGLFGDGGRIETSGHYLDVNNIQINASSLHGKTGIWLLDPYDIVISEAATSSGAFNGGTPDTFLPTATSVLNAADLNTALSGAANVVVTTTPSPAGGPDAGNITFTNNLTPINWSGSNSLTFLADNSIIFSVNNAINKTSGTGVLNLRADSDANFTGTVTMVGGIDIISTGIVNVFYNPTAFTDAINPYDTNISAAVKNQYMLVYDETVAAAAGHYLPDIATGAPATYWNKNYALAQNITLTASQNSIGTTATPYSGLFTGINSVLNDGSTYSIINLVVSEGATTDVGLFGALSGTLSNLTLDNPTVTGDVNVGGMVGRVASGGALTGTLATVNGGLITGNTNVGGIAGNVASATVSATVDAATSVTGTQRIGGLFGYVTNTTFSSALSNTGGNVTGVDEVGGLIGFSDTGNAYTSTLTLTRSSGSSSITGTGNATGGLIGVLSTSALNFQPTSASVLEAGGNITVNGSTAVGGLFGYIDNVGTATFNTGTLVNNADVNSSGGLGIVGGIIGASDYNGSAMTFTGTVTNTGNITSSTGIVGGIFGGITNGTFVGAVSNSGNVLVTGSTHSNIGGIGGIIGNVSITSYFNTVTNTGTVSTTFNDSSVIGGLFGYAEYVEFNNALSYAGDISGADTLGGLVGSAVSAVFHSTATYAGNVTGTGSDIGGLFGGLTNSTVDQASFAGTVTGVTNVGGIVGNIVSGSISRAYNNSISTVKGNMFVGGIAGRVGSAASINNALFGGVIEIVGVGGSNIGGLVGWNDGTVLTSLAVTSPDASSGWLIGTGSNIGAIAGTNSATGVLTDPFYSSDTFAGYNAVGNNLGTDNSHSATSISLSDPATFTLNWNFSTTWEPLTVSNVQYYVTLSWCGVNCGVVNAYIIPPAPPTPAVPNYARQYVTVEQTLINTPTYSTFYTFYSVDMLYSIDHYIVPMSGYSDPFMVVDFSGDTESPEAAANTAESVLRQNGLGPQSCGGL